MKHKLFYGILLVCLLAGCGNQTQNQTPTPTNAPTTAPSRTPEPTATTAPVATTAPAATTAPTKTPVVEEVGFKLTADGADTYEISDILYGLFLEDINYAIDGGMYAELIKNRSFEFEDSLASGGHFHGWSKIGSVSYEIIDGSKDGSYLNANNPHYLSLTSNAAGAGIKNSGFLNGMACEEGKTYVFSAFLRAPEGITGPVTVRLTNSSGKEDYGSATIENVTKDWWKYEVTLTAVKTVDKRLALAVLFDGGTLELDMVSLFPQDTYKNQKNGLRADLVQLLEDINPGFLRFPGGCIIEGRSLEHAYDWKDSIGNGMEMMINGELTVGDVATRPLAINLWGDGAAVSRNPYYMTYGFGFYEFFLLCEDLGCEPVPIVNAGLACQAQGNGSGPDIGSAEFERYIQDALDLVEFANGDASTYWGSVRIAMGHEEPFHLVYLGIGNEQWDEIYFERYEEFLAAFKQAAIDNPELYGNIQLIVSNGPQSENSWAWDKIAVHGKDYAGIVDEHYYREPDWFLAHAKRYDNYDRNSVPVFLGEYASRSNTLRSALAEAAYMTALERNGDIVHLAAYAPLFANTSLQWNPDLIWFNNREVWPSANYYVQKLFGNNKTDKVAVSTLTGNKYEDLELTGKVGLGTWQTSAVFDDVKVVSNKTGEVLYTEDFSDTTLSDFEVVAGDFSLTGGSLVQNYFGWPSNTINGDVLYFGDAGWTDYTLTLTATKTDGAEGFLIPFAVQNAQNNYHWNIGGWGNTVSCLESIVNNVKSGQTDGTVRAFKVENGVAYHLKVVVSGSHIECYIDDVQYVSYDIPQADDLYQVTGVDEDGNVIIKLVNVTEEAISLKIDLNNFGALSDTADVTVLTGENLAASNSQSQPDIVVPATGTMTVAEEFEYEVPAISLVVIKIPKK